MSVQVGTIYKVDNILDTNYQTYSVVPAIKGTGNKINVLFISDIDLNKKQVVLKCLDPKNNFTLEQCKALAAEHKIIMIQKDEKKGIYFSVSEKLKNEIPTSLLKLVLQTENERVVLPKLDILQFLSTEKYFTLAKEFTPFMRLVVRQTKLQTVQQ